MNLTIDNIGLGAVSERFDEELVKVVGNILDHNTDPKVKRKINIELTIAPNQDNRELCSMAVKVSSKLAPSKTLVSALTVGMDRRTGEVDAIEIVPQQGKLFPEDKKVPGKVVTMTASN